MAAGRLIPGRHDLCDVRPLAADPAHRSLTEHLYELRDEDL